MKRTLTALPWRPLGLVVALAAGVTGCGPAEFTHPLIPLSDGAPDSRLEGRWCSPDDPDDGWVTFTSAQDASGTGFYRMTIVDPDEDEPVLWAAWLGKVGDVLFINVAPAADPRVAGGFMFGRAWLTDDRLGVALVESDWAKRWARAMGFEATERAGGEPAIAAPASALQWLASALADDADAFGDDYELVRAPSESGCEAAPRRGGQALGG